MCEGMMTRFGCSRPAMICRPCDSLQLGEMLSGFAPFKILHSKADNDLRVPLDDELWEVIFNSQLQSFDETPEFCYIVRSVPQGARSYDKNLPIVITEDHSIPCSSGISFRGSVKIEFDEVLWGRSPMGRPARGRGGRGEGGV
jgi:hypothetical protein